METSQRGRLSEHCAQLPDPRGDRPNRHRLLDMVVIAVCAVIGGADTWGAIEAYGRAKYEWLQRFLPLPHGMPSHDTLARVLARLRPAAFRTGFPAGLTAVQEPIGGVAGPPPGGQRWQGRPAEFGPRD